MTASEDEPKKRRYRPRGHQTECIVRSDGTALVPLGNGVFAIIDSADVELASEHLWSPFRVDGLCYALTSGTESQYLHRHLLGLKRGDQARVDHRDGDGLNCCRGNLRVATSAQNSWNTKRAAVAKRTSRFKGVSLNRKRRRWIALITKHGTVTVIGGFKDEADAARAYDRAALNLFGEFARTNAMMGLYDDAQGVVSAKMPLEIRYFGE